MIEFLGVRHLQNSLICNGSKEGKVGYDMKGR